MLSACPGRSLRPFPRQHQIAGTTSKVRSLDPGGTSEPIDRKRSIENMAGLSAHHFSDSRRALPPPAKASMPTLSAPRICRHKDSRLAVIGVDLHHALIEKSAQPNRLSNGDRSTRGADCESSARGTERNLQPSVPPDPHLTRRLPNSRYRTQISFKFQTVPRDPVAQRDGLTIEGHRRNALLSLRKVRISPPVSASGSRRRRWKAFAAWSSRCSSPSPDWCWSAPKATKCSAPSRRTKCCSRTSGRHPVPDESPQETCLPPDPESPTKYSHGRCGEINSTHFPPRRNRLGHSMLYTSRFRYSNTVPRYFHAVRSRPAASSSWTCTTSAALPQIPAAHHIGFPPSRNRNGSRHSFTCAPRES